LRRSTGRWARTRRSESSRYAVRAVRLRPNVVVPEIEVAADRTIPVGPQARGPESWPYSLAGKLAALQRAVGLDERKLRERLRRDERFSQVADAEFPSPRTSITPAEAALLIERGLADPVTD
jgi:hypothetical protein